MKNPSLSSPTLFSVQTPPSNTVPDRVASLGYSLVLYAITTSDTCPSTSSREEPLARLLDKAFGVTNRLEPLILPDIRNILDCPVWIFLKIVI